MKLLSKKACGKKINPYKKSKHLRGVQNLDEESTEAIQTFAQNEKCLENFNLNVVSKICFHLDSKEKER
jgi:hypothetical protein